MPVSGNGRAWVSATRGYSCSRAASDFDQSKRFVAVAIQAVRQRPGFGILARTHADHNEWKCDIFAESHHVDGSAPDRQPAVPGCALADRSPLLIGEP